VSREPNRCEEVHVKTAEPISAPGFIWISGELVNTSAIARVRDYGHRAADQEAVIIELVGGSSLKVLRSSAIAVNNAIRRSLERVRA
jgi:hypothetical protein